MVQRDAAAVAQSVGEIGERTEDRLNILADEARGKDLPVGFAFADGDVYNCSRHLGI